MTIFVPFGGRYPANTFSVEFPAPKAPTFTGCLATPAELRYYDLYTKAVSRQMPLALFWWALITRGPDYGVDNSALLEAINFYNRYNLSGSNATSLLFPIYSRLRPPLLTQRPCIIPGSPVALGFGNTYADLPEPMAAYRPVVQTVPGPYAYTEEDCRLLAQRAYDSDYGANNSLAITMFPDSGPPLGTVCAVESPSGEYGLYRAVGSEFNATGDAATKTITMTKVAPPLNEPEKDEEGDEVFYYREQCDPAADPDSSSGAFNTTYVFDYLLDPSIGSTPASCRLLSINFNYTIFSPPDNYTRNETYAIEAAPNTGPIVTASPSIAQPSYSVVTINAGGGMVYRLGFNHFSVNTPVPGALSASLISNTALPTNQCVPYVQQQLRVYQLTCQLIQQATPVSASIVTTFNFNISFYAPPSESVNIGTYPASNTNPGNFSWLASSSVPGTSLYRGYWFWGEGIIPFSTTQPIWSISEQGITRIS